MSKAQYLELKRALDYTVQGKIQASVDGATWSVGNVEVLREVKERLTKIASKFVALGDQRRQHKTVDDNHMRCRSSRVASEANLPRKNNKTKRKFGEHHMCCMR